MRITSELTDDETEALARKTAEEGRSVQDVARSAVDSYSRDEDVELRTLVASILHRDRELLDRLAQRGQVDTESINANRSD